MAKKSETYEKGNSCGRGHHRFVNRGTYFKCSHCGASKHLKGYEAGTKRVQRKKGRRSKVERA